MSAMKNMDVNSEDATAWVEAGVTVKDLDDVTCPRGLAAVNGSCTDVGIIGFMLGGGFGFLSRTQGLAVDNCLQMEVVTPAGQRIVASPHEYRELFWALRGAGQVGYGVVTRVQVKLHKLQQEYVGGERLLLFNQRSLFITLSARCLSALVQNKLETEKDKIRIVVRFYLRPPRKINNNNINDNDNNYYY